MQATAPASRSVAAPAESGLHALNGKLEAYPEALTARRVVIADSHEDNRDLYAVSFTLAGFPVSACSTVDEVLDSVARAAPAAVITSVRLRGKDGFTLCDTLKATPATRGIPIVVLTTCASDHERAIHDPRVAAAAMLPCLPAALIGLVAGILSKQRGPAHRAA